MRPTSSGGRKTGTGAAAEPKVHPQIAAQLEAQRAREAAGPPDVQPNDPTQSLMFKGSAEDRRAAQVAYAKRVKAEAEAARSRGGTAGGGAGGDDPSLHC